MSNVKKAQAVSLWFAVVILIFTAHILSLTDAWGEGVGPFALSALAIVPICFVVWWLPQIRLPQIRVEASDHQREQRQNTPDKAKRSTSHADDRITLLLELMTEDEKAAFKEALQYQVLSEHRLADDGEFVTNDDPMWQDRYR